MDDSSTGDLNAAPTAPEGWYPHPTRPDLDRFWDGKSWTLDRPNGKPAPTAADADLDALDPAEEPAVEVATAAPGKRNRWWIAVASGVAALAIIFGVLGATGVLSGHDDGPPDAATQSRINEALGVTDKADIPAGFNDLGNGLAVKWTTSEHKVGNTTDCEFGTSCSFMEVFATQDCPSDVYVAVNDLDASGVVVDNSNDSLPALEAGQTGELEFDYTHGGGTSHLASSSCL